MLQKNILKQERKQKRHTWEGYYPRVVNDKSKYTRKGEDKRSCTNHFLSND